MYTAAAAAASSRVTWPWWMCLPGGVVSVIGPSRADIASSSVALVFIQPNPRVPSDRVRNISRRPVLGDKSPAEAARMPDRAPRPSITRARLFSNFARRRRINPARRVCGPAPPSVGWVTPTPQPAPGGRAGAREQLTNGAPDWIGRPDDGMDVFGGIKSCRKAWCRFRDHPRRYSRGGLIASAGVVPATTAGGIGNCTRGSASAAVPPSRNIASEWRLYLAMRSPNYIRLQCRRRPHPRLCKSGCRHNDSIFSHVWIGVPKILTRYKGG